MRGAILRLAGVATALVLGLSLAGCGDDSETSSEATPSATADGTGGGDSEGTSGNSEGHSTGAEGGSNDGRAFDSDDDAVILAVIAATRADRAEWQGKTLIVHFSEGSSTDPTSGAKCGAAVVLADDENAVMRFPDGEIDCSQR